MNLHKFQSVCSVLLAYGRLTPSVLLRTTDIQEGSRLRVNNSPQLAPGIGAIVVQHQTNELMGTLTNPAPNSCGNLPKTYPLFFVRTDWL